MILYRRSIRNIFGGLIIAALIMVLICGRVMLSDAETIQDTELAVIDVTADPAESAGGYAPAAEAEAGNGSASNAAITIDLAEEAGTEAETRELTPEELEELARRQAARDTLRVLSGCGTDETMAGLGSDGTWLVDEPGDGGWSLSKPAPFSIMVRFDRDYEMLTEGQTGNWRRSFKGHYLWDDDALYAWFGKLKEKYDSEPGIVHFTTHDGKKLTFESTNCGWQMNLDLTVLRLKEYVGLGEEIMDPVWNSGLVYSSMNDVGTKYVEVDIANQKVYLFEDGELLLESDCVTGTRDWTDTTTGVYQVEYKASPAVLKDKDPNGNKYEQPVEYWISFNHSQGLHDAIWRGEFGGEIYKSWGSHGCVNLPLEAAEKIYKEVYNYYPVIVYDTTRENIPDEDLYAETESLTEDLGAAGSWQEPSAGMGVVPAEAGAETGAAGNDVFAGADGTGVVVGTDGTGAAAGADGTGAAVGAAAGADGTGGAVGADGTGVVVGAGVSGTDVGAGASGQATGGAPQSQGDTVSSDGQISDLDFPGGVLF